jgi:F-box and WD-40 domain protein MET30
VHTGVCENVFKFADPISVTKLRQDMNFMFTASWDKMIRVIDLDKQLVVKSFVASKETIKEMIITDELIIIAGCEPIIRAFSHDTGKQKIF